MPRTIFDKPKRDKLGELIRGTMAVQEKTANDFAAVMGCCYNSAKKRLKSPQDMTINDVIKTARWLGITIDEIRQAIG